MNDRIKVWDLPLRIFHWLLVAAFFVAYLTEEDSLSLHVWAGYTVIGLVVFRLIWGFIGSPYAGFSNFIGAPTRSVRYLMETVGGKAKRYIGHNPAGAAMIVLLFVSLVFTSVTGLAVYGAEEQAGPLAGMISQDGKLWEEVHDFSANVTLFLVFLHILGVLFESRQHGENLIQSMITGYKIKTVPKYSTIEVNKDRS